eukprot:CAMPEP_0175804850 /NCGR_PEP_ID=MMETSP0107_2-20121207/345_1 /TAXON_ID=195067 ORGANISM="Goniomonas pacifica, Strain CCMP1869" /NCGR_SAMPLE_ID=MMETSP0107_2 /ASSEMBLY_ACC=CAM_ASM_000203 /LENGTH=165 /DNA_ID=CAMNT_0017116237 /DNA_START=10 /DNA_END=507 /DNA_ORIENTATION=+
MANQAVKAKLKENTALLFKYFWIIILVNAAYAGVRFGLYGDTYTKWHAISFGLTSLIYYAAYATLKTHALPAHAADPEEIDHVGDLSQGGVIEFCWDAIYVNIFVQLTSLYSDWFWLLWLVVPAYALYALWGSVISPLLAAKKSAANFQSRKERRAEARGKNKVR